MKRNVFNEPRPENPEELEAALRELDLDSSEVSALIDHEPYDPKGANEAGVNMTGYTAHICDQDGEHVFSTVGFERRETLAELLATADIEITDG